MTVEEARCIYLSFAGAEEGSHMGHPDFRVNGHIFATVWPTKDLGVLRLPMDFGQGLIEERPTIFSRKGKSGGWIWVGVELPLIEETEFRDLAAFAFEKRK
jgi:hypothetical protein